MFGFQCSEKVEIFEGVEKLSVYRRAYQISLEVHHLSKTLLIMMSIGSADEMKVWLNYAHDLGYIDSTVFNKLSSEYLEIAKMLQGPYKTSPSEN